jgi:hypothetical protein
MPEPPADDTTFADARSAAEALVKQREETQSEARPIEEIKYFERNEDGSQSDRPTDDRQYISAERGADDLKAYRDQRAEAAKAAETQAIQALVDAERAATEYQKPGGEAQQGESVEEWGRRVAEGLQQQQADADVIKAGREALSHLDQAIAGESDPNMIAGLQNKRAEVYQMTSEAELRQVLKDNPNIAYELEKEVGRQTQAAQAQVQANLQQVAQAAEYARAAIFAEPEFAGLRADQIATAEQILQRDNPVRHAELTERANNVHRLVQHGR